MGYALPAGAPARREFGCECESSLFTPHLLIAKEDHVFFLIVHPTGRTSAVAIF
jgi:hypothetical protein